MLFVAEKSLKILDKIKKIVADQGYQKTFENHCQSKWKVEVEISKKITDPNAVSPFRWIVERSLSWLNGQRIMSKD